MKYSNEEIVNIFEQSGFTYVDNFKKGKSTYHNVICKDNHHVCTTFGNFNKRRYCVNCKKRDEKNEKFLYVKEFFRKNNCILLENEYEKCSLPLKYICKCGNESKIRFNDFRRGVRCKSCMYENLSEKFSFDYDYVYEFFAKNNCKLLSKKYKNSSSKLLYVCKCGNRSEITFSMFKSGQRCKKCRSEKISDSIRLSYDEVAEFFEKQDCKLLTKEYINSSIHLKYKCACGEIAHSTFNNFQRRKRCCACGGKTNWTYEKVKSVYEDEGCILLSFRYIKALSKLKFICSCGNMAENTFVNFRNGSRCKECNNKKYAGENNWNWKGGRSKLSSYLRGLTLEWKKESMKDCNYKCVITGKRFDVIHHLYGFNRVLEEVQKEVGLDLSKSKAEYSDSELKTISHEFMKIHNKYPLGVCLTNEVHEEFHRKYGYGNNTPEQFEVFQKNFYLKQNI